MQISHQEYSDKVGAFGKQQKIDIGGSVDSATWQSVAKVSPLKSLLFWQTRPLVALSTT
jgi:hypothetical protein